MNIFFCSNGVYFEMNGNIDGILDGRIDFWWFLLEYVTCVSSRIQYFLWIMWTYYVVQIYIIICNHEEDG